ncbi:MAG: iron-sulfur cluster assembly accessory protein [Waddliaceae bacterium]|nr:iron-sulfur cluster assembly accessory protein [Waddliaceae bacterium]
MQDQRPEKPIHKHMVIQEILRLFPGKGELLGQELTNTGLHCVGCGAATFETLLAGMLGHGKTMADVDALVDRLNAIVSQKVDMTTITISDQAATKFLEACKVDGKQGYGLRLEEKPGNCGDFEYVLDFAKQADENDDIFNTPQGIPIYVKRSQRERLLGSSIDYIDGGLMGSGFKVSNPNVVSSCGCGSNHSYR